MTFKYTHLKLFIYAYIKFGNLIKHALKMRALIVHGK